MTDDPKLAVVSREERLRRVHDEASAIREKVAEFVGAQLVVAADRPPTAFAGVGNVAIPIERVRALVFSLLEVAHVLALGDKDGGPNATTSLSSWLRLMDGTMLEEVRTEISRGVVTESSRPTSESTVPSILDGVGGRKGPIGQA